MSVRKLHLHLALCALFATTAVLWAVRPEGTAAAPPKEAAAPSARSDDLSVPLRNAALRQAIGGTVDFPGSDDPKITLGEALDQLSRLYRVQIVLNQRTMQIADIPDPYKIEIGGSSTIPKMRTSLRNVLLLILRRLPMEATFLVRRDHIEITTVQAARDELRLHEEEPLLPLVNEDFKKEPLTEALDRIADATDTTVVVDVSSQDKAKLEVSARLTNVPVDTAVRLLAHMAGLDVTRVNNALYVTTSEKATSLQKALVREAHGSLAPGAAAGLGGLGGIGGLGGAGLLGGVPNVTPK